jgi:hypothetical protein
VVEVIDAIPLDPEGRRQMFDDKEEEAERA